jgi:hypothetical protein
VASDTGSKIASAAQVVLALASAFAIYEFGIARNRGTVPPWLDTAVPLVFVIGVPLLFLVQARHWENVYVGSLIKSKPTLEAGEVTVFKSRFMSAQFFPAGTFFKPNLTFLEWLGGGPFTVQKLLTVRLTNRRLIFGLLIGRTWRLVELSSVRNINLINGKWPYRDALLIEYESSDRDEKLLLWTKSRKHKKLITALQQVTKRG